MNRRQLIDKIRNRRTFLCVGLDTDVRKIPSHFAKSADPIFEFNRAIVDATRDYCVAYKLNTAFYEAEGVKGWEAMERTADYIGDTHFRIADAKRGDIGNTSSLYARAFFERMPFDAITVSPYMGEDSIRPFLEYENKWTIVLGLTSNKGSEDFQQLKLDNNKKVYGEVLRKVSAWGTPDNLMFVVGATQSADLKNIRELLPAHFFLVPGVGAQGGSLEQICKDAVNEDIGILVNASRAIIYPTDAPEFPAAVEQAARSYQQQMSAFLK